MPKADLSFKVFWDAYPDHHARAVAERIWKRLSQKDRRAALAAIAPYREECEAKGVAFKYAPGWLTDRRWEDYSESNHPTCNPTPSSSPTRGGEFGDAGTKKELSAGADALEDMDTW